MARRDTPPLPPRSIFDRIATLATTFGGNAQLAGQYARRWRAAYDQDPRLGRDLVEFSKMLRLTRDALPPPGVGSLDPLRVMYDAGRSDAFVELLALMGVSIEEINELIEE